MTFKGQEEDNRHQLSKITKGVNFTVIYHCLLLGGRAFLVCFPPQHEHLSVVGLEGLVWVLGGLRQADSTSAEPAKLEKG